MKLTIVFLLGLSAFGQSVSLAPVPKQQFLDSNGHPLAGGKVFSYASGTSTLLPTYADASGTTPNPNPLILDSAGRGNLWLSTTSTYRLQLTDANGVQVWLIDGIQGSGTGGGGGTGVTSVFGRIGTVTAQGGDYTISQITNGVANNASNTYTGGTQNFSGAAHTIPTKVGTIATIPATCTVGEQYFAIDAPAGSNVYNCTATNTWTGGSFLPLGGGTMTGSILFNPTDTFDLGSLSGEIRKIYVRDIAITGSCSGAGCGGAGSFLPTGGGTMTGNIDSGPIGTLSLGSKPHPFGSTFALTNVSSRKLEIYGGGAADLSGPFWNIQATDDIVTKQLFFYDDLNLPIMRLTRLLGGVSLKKGEFDGDWVPMVDATYNLGSAVGPARWLNIAFTGTLTQGSNTILDASRNATINNLTILGTCSGCPGSGGGTFLPLAGGTMAGNILANAVNTLAVGSKTAPFAGGYFMGNASTRQVELYDVGAADLNGIFFTITANVASFGKQLNFKDDAGNTIFSIATVIAGAVHHQASLFGDLSPSAPNTFDLGVQQSWRDIYWQGRLIQGPTTRLDSSGNAFVNNLTVAGTCTGCGGGGGGVTSLTAVSPVVVTASTGAVQVSCPGCPLLNANNNFSGNNTFGLGGSGGTTINNVLIANFGVTTSGLASSGNVSGNQLQIFGTTVVDGARNGFFGGLSTTSAATFNGGVNIPSGSNSTIFMGTFGNFYLRTFASGGAPSCSGVADGWSGFNTSNNVLYICNGGFATAH